MHTDRPRRLRRIARLSAGFTLLPVGVALLVLPGPGLPLVAGGLWLLEGELQWARRARRQLDQALRRLRAAAQRGKSSG